MTMLAVLIFNSIDQVTLESFTMKINFSLLSFVLLTFVVSTLFVNYSCAFVEICFIRNNLIEKQIFNESLVWYADARNILELTADDIFMDGNLFIKREMESRMLVNEEECNVIINQSANSPIEVCIVNDQCKTIVLKNNANVNTLREKLLASLPKYYGDENCAAIVFLNDQREVILHSEEVDVPYRNIVKNGRIEAYNKFIDNTTELDITWSELYSHRVQVNMLMSLSNLRYWITKPYACPNLKDKLNLPDKMLFPNSTDDLARNWLARDKKRELDEVSSIRFVAPYDHEKYISIELFAYKIEESKIRRLYYVDVLARTRSLGPRDYPIIDDIPIF